MVKLYSWRVVRRSPVSDPFRLTGIEITAQTEDDAWLYLGETMVPRRAPRGFVTSGQYKGLVKEYELVLLEPVQFNGTKEEWIRAIDSGAMPKAVRFPVEDEFSNETALESPTGTPEVPAKAPTKPPVVSQGSDHIIAMATFLGLALTLTGAFLFGSWAAVLSGVSCIFIAVILYAVRSPQ